MATRTLTMSHRKLDRFGVITRVRERRLTQVEAARMLNLGVRLRLSYPKEALDISGTCHLEIKLPNGSEIKSDDFKR